MKKLALIFAFLLGSFAVFSQQAVEPFSGMLNANSSQFYSLPKTKLVIEIETRKTVQKAGPYAEYANEYFGMEDSEIILRDNVRYEISGFSIKTIGVPDESRMFQITAGINSRANFIQRNSNGIICGVNLSFPCVECSQNNLPESRNSTDEIRVLFDRTLLPKEYFEAASHDERLEAIVNQIFKLREAQTEILSGFADNVPSDAAGVKFMVNELKRRENALLEFFTGKSVTVTERKTINLLPSGRLNNNLLFTFSATEGFVDGGERYYISLLPSVMEVQRQTPERGRVTNGFFHIIPANVDVRIFTNRAEVFQSNVLMAQFGSVVSLPANLLERNDVSIVFDTRTGALKSIHNRQ